MAQSTPEKEGKLISGLASRTYAFLMTDSLPSWQRSSPGATMSHPKSQLGKILEKKVQSAQELIKIGGWKNSDEFWFTGQQETGWGEWGHLLFSHPQPHPRLELIHSMSFLALKNLRR